MTKEDILAMTKSVDVFKALKANPELLDDNTGERFNVLAKQEWKNKLNKRGIEGTNIRIDGYPMGEGQQTYREMLEEMKK